MVSRMKLIKYSTIPAKQKKILTTIIGFEDNIPTTYAKYVNSLGWEILQSEDKQKLSKKQKLITVSIENSLEDVLHFFKQTSLVPFCLADKHKDLHLDKYLVEKHINRRKHYRKKVALNGNFFNKRTKYGGGFRTQDISLRGLKFKSKSKHDIILGDTLMVDYVLKNAQKNKIIRDIKTVHIKEKQVGAEIINPPLLDPDLGFYLME
jgi:PilZ domain-containing protein